jgi:hypothetical protein
MSTFQRLIVCHCVVFLAGLLLLNGCASGSGRDTGSRYSASIGTATRYDFTDKAQYVLVSKHRYEIEDVRDGTESITFETKWMERVPFDDEAQQGIIGARTKVILEARARTRGGLEARALYTVRFRGETMVQFINDESWVTESLSPQAHEYLRSISRELEAEYRAGMHRF